MSLDKFKIEKSTKKYIGLIDPEAEIDIEIEDNGCRINIDSSLSAMLIGYHGETLEALQHVLRLILIRELEEFVPITIDVSGYRANQFEELKKQAEVLAMSVIAGGQSQKMQPMNSYERRIVHVALTDVDGIEVVSVGEEPYRCIEIKPKGK